MTIKNSVSKFFLDCDKVESNSSLSLFLIADHVGVNIHISGQIISGLIEMQMLLIQMNFRDTKWFGKNISPIKYYFGKDTKKATKKIFLKNLPTNQFSFECCWSVKIMIVHLMLRVLLGIVSVQHCSLHFVITVNTVFKQEMWLLKSQLFFWKSPNLIHHLLSSSPHSRTHFHPLTSSLSGWTL